MRTRNAAGRVISAFATSWTLAEWKPVNGVATVPSLFVIRGVDQGTRFELDEPAVGIGRESSNAVQ